MVERGRGLWELEHGREDRRYLGEDLGVDMEVDGVGGVKGDVCGMLVEWVGSVRGWSGSLTMHGVLCVTQVLIACAWLTVWKIGKENGGW